jgi:hypothetical protein
MATKLSECDAGDDQIITALHNIITQEDVAKYDKDCLKQLASGCALLIKPLEQALMGYCIQCDLKKTSAKRKSELKTLISVNNLKMGQWAQKAKWINQLLMYAQNEGVTARGPGSDEEEEEAKAEEEPQALAEQDEEEQNGDDGELVSTGTQRPRANTNADERSEEEETVDEEFATPAGGHSSSSKQASSTRSRTPTPVAVPISITRPRTPVAAPISESRVSESRVLGLESRLLEVENTQTLRRSVPQFTSTDLEETVPQQKFTAIVPFKLRSSKVSMLYGSAELLSSDWFSSDGIQVRVYIGEQAVSPTEVVFKAAHSLLNDLRLSATAELGSVQRHVCPFIEWLKDPSLSVPVSSDFDFDSTVTVLVLYILYL